MEKLSWLKTLVKAEQELEESGMIDISAGFDPNKVLEVETVEFLTDLKVAFTETANTFNDMKTSPLGRIKIYGVAKTQADFMLFRNGYKLLFSMTRPGEITIRFNFVSANFIPQNNPTTEPNNQVEDRLEARYGVFGEVEWTYRGYPVKMDGMVRYFMSRYIQDSVK